MKLKAFVKLTRIEHALFLVIAVIVGQIISLGGTLPPYHLIILASLCPFFIEIGSFAINDYWDVETDRANKRRDRPLVTGELSPRTALVTAAISFPLGVIIAWFINVPTFLIAALFAMLAVVYSHTLKKSPFFGNFFIAFSMAIPFIFGNLSVTETLLLPVSFLASLALIMGVGREIAKSIMDYAGDRKQRRFTLPIAIGKQNASYISAFFILFAVLISVIPFFYFAQYYFDYLYLVPILITDVLLLVSLCLILKLKKLKDVRFLTLAAQGTGLAGFLLGAIF